eukprot:COSAG06_NODE_1616_length_8924_cov_9.604419_1_plen_92_part_00
MYGNVRTAAAKGVEYCCVLCVSELLCCAMLSGCSHGHWCRDGGEESTQRHHDTDHAVHERIPLPPAASSQQQKQARWSEQRYIQYNLILCQ